MQSSFVRLILAVIIISSLVVAFSWSGNWVHLGKRTVDHRADRDVIKVKNSEGFFTRIRLEVRNRPVQMLDLKVHFDNGQIFDVGLAKQIPAGGHTQFIDLPGGPRVIRRVEFHYRSVGTHRGKAVVHLWAR